MVATIYNDRINNFIEKNGFSKTEFDKDTLYKIIDNVCIYYCPVFLENAVYYIPIYSKDFNPYDLEDIYPNRVIRDACAIFIYVDFDYDIKFLEVDKELINNNDYHEIDFSDRYDSDSPTACGVITVPAVYKTYDSVIIEKLNRGFII